MFSIGKKLLKEPFSNIYEHVYHFLKNDSSEVKKLASEFIQKFEKEQAQFISKFYSKLKLSSLKKLLGVHLMKINFKEYLHKYNWVQNGEVILTSQIKESSNTQNIREDLDFINKMTVSLENLAKVNSSLRPAEI